MLLSLCLLVGWPLSAKACNLKSGQWRTIEELVESDRHKQAVPLLLNEHRAHCNRASRYLGNIYARGLDGNAPSFKKAHIYWRSAAERGDRQAQSNIALQFFQGDGVEKNLASAQLWASRSAEQNNPLGLKLISKILTDSGNIAEAKLWHDRAIELGLFDDLVKTAVTLLTKGHSKHAIYLLGSGAARGHLRSLRLLGEQLFLSDNKPEQLKGINLLLLSGAHTDNRYINDIEKKYRQKFGRTPPFPGPSKKYLWSNSINNDVLELSYQYSALPLSARKYAEQLIGTISDDRRRFEEIVVRTSLGLQGKVGHPAERDPQAVARGDTFGKVGNVTNAITLNTTAGAFATYNFFIKGLKADVPISAYLSPETAWNLLNTGTGVFLSDLVTNHISTVMFVDKIDDRVYFAEGWPDKFFLKEGENLLDIKSRTKKRYGLAIPHISKTEFIQAVQGISFTANERFPESFLSLHPAARTDWRIRLMFGTKMLQYANACSNVSRALDHLEHALKAAGTSKKRIQLISDRIVVAKEVQRLCVGSREVGVPRATFQRWPLTLSFDEVDRLVQLYGKRNETSSRRSLLRRFLDANPSHGVAWFHFALEYEQQRPVLMEALNKAIGLMRGVVNNLDVAKNYGLVVNRRRDSHRRNLSLAYQVRAIKLIKTKPEKALEDALAAIDLTPDIQAHSSALRTARATKRNSLAAKLQKDIKELQKKAYMRRITNQFR
jgi:hypothetical protein